VAIRKSLRLRQLARAGLPFALLLLLLSLPGCTHWIDTVSVSADAQTYEVYGSRVMGQAFVCRHAGLDGISVLLSARESSRDLVLHLRASPDSETDIATATLSPLQGTGPAFYHFAFPVQDDVNGRSFFLLIESPASPEDGSLLVPYTVQENSDHALYLGDESSPGYISFQLHYNSLYILKDLGRQAVTHGLNALWLLFLTVLLLLLPGGAAVVWLLPEGEWIERLIMAAGISVALNALLVYATMTGLRLGPGAIRVFVALCSASILAKWGLEWKSGKRWRISLGDAWSSVKRDPSPLVLLLAFALVLIVRLFVVRDLVAPMWGDSYQHTMIVQLLADHGGLFESWEPYAPLITLTYHFGFHANVVTFHWLSGDPILHSVIWMGQILNALAVLMLYPIAVKVSGGNRWAGVIAVLLAGLLSHMPMYYVNWGRYTQLAGQVVLPALAWLAWLMIERRKWDWRLTVLTALTGTGLGIIHYRVFLLYGVFLVALGVVAVVHNRKQWRQIGLFATQHAASLGLMLALFLPWGLNVFRARIPDIGGYALQQSNQSGFDRSGYAAIGSVYFYIPIGILILSGLGLLWLILRRRSSGWIMLLWVGGLLLLANPYLLSLPGAGIVDNFAVFIMLYIPAGILGGVFLSDLCVQAWRKTRWMSLVLVIAIVLASGWGFVQRVKDLSLEHAMVTEADMEAIEWIRENTPPDARFLVNGFLAYEDTSVVGADAGWWIPLLTTRWSTVPPLTYGAELSVDPQYHQHVKEWFVFLQKASPTSDEGVQFLHSLGITHVYIGQGGGMVGNPGEPMLDPAALLASSAYRVVYSRDGVWIFALV
jgi:hypothetical protein